MLFSTQNRAQSLLFLNSLGSKVYTPIEPQKPGFIFEFQTFLMPGENLLSLHEAVVVALINRPIRTASFEQIAAFIDDRNLYPKTESEVLLAEEVMLLTTKSAGAYSHLFEEIGAGFIRLKDSYADFTLHIYAALEALLEYDKRFYKPELKELSVIDKSYGSKETRKIQIRPNNVICILSHEKSRKKNVYIFEKELNSIQCYEFNNQDFNFKTLCKYLDPLNNYLIQIAKNAIVNVAYFNLVKNRLLEYNGLVGKTEEFSTIKISDKGKGDLFIQNFKTIKEAYNRRILLQNTSLGYKNNMGL